MQRPKRNRRPEAHIENMPHEWLNTNKYKPMMQTEFENECKKNTGLTRKSW